MQLFTAPEGTVTVALSLQGLDAESATFTYPHDNKTRVILSRQLWEGCGHPARLEVPIAESVTWIADPAEEPIADKPAVDS